MIEAKRSDRYVILEELLVRQELDALMRYALEREPDFRASGVVAGDDPAYRDHRRSSVLLDTGPFHRLMGERIAFYLPHVLRALGVSPFTLSHVESQITASGDGDYFKRHDDNTRGCAPTRELSYVAFFHREPKPFEGGELLLYELPGERSDCSAASVIPTQASIVFFASGRPHEVLPVRCASRAFSDSRFTINGWIHRSGG